VVSRTATLKILGAMTLIVVPVVTVVVAIAATTSHAVRLVCLGCGPVPTRHPGHSGAHHERLTRPTLSDDLRVYRAAPLIGGVASMRIAVPIDPSVDETFGPPHARAHVAVSWKSIEARRWRGHVAQLRHDLATNAVRIGWMRYQGRRGLAYGMVSRNPTICVSMNPSVTPRGRCVHWTFFSATDGKFVDSTSQRIRRR
jgi:hypothetical protein